MSMDYNELIERSANDDRDISVSRSPKEREMLYATDVEPYLLPLTQKQLKFVYALCGNNMNVPKASEEAGITRDYGHKLLTNPNVRKAYTALMNQRNFHKVMGYQEVLEFATSVVRGEIKDTTLNMKTGEAFIHEPLVKDRFKYLETLMKHNNVLADKQLLSVQATGKTTIMVDIEGMEDFDFNSTDNLNEPVRKDITDDIIDI
ncbi:terminase small subunit [Bacillus wiedmannii]|uniref:terminase small subunit n=1 Tax=Bacillus wiedmannii TaxID=1890302 RepID=UPI0021D0291E|nr:terminase small subunit [Bacillus wiedmannii]MCU5682007.1 terminase small subunit [Bacillus wiedmannii]